MGKNGCLPSFLCASSRGRRAARLVLWGGESRAARRGTQAGQVMLDVAAGTVVCRADAFYLGRPAPVLAIEDRLAAGATYLVLPVDRLPHDAAGLTAASLAALSYDRWAATAAAGAAGAAPSSPSIAGGPKSPFEYVKADDGRTVIKVTPEFLVRAVTATTTTSSKDKAEGGAEAGALCSTPELRKHYEQLVGAARGRAWSPRLDTINERKGRRRGAAAFAAAVSPGRLSPVAVRLLGLDGGQR